MHHDDGPSFTLHSRHRKQVLWKTCSLALTRSAAYTTLAQRAHFSPPPPNRPKEEERITRMTLRAGAGAGAGAAESGRAAVADMPWSNGGAGVRGGPGAGAASGATTMELRREIGVSPSAAPKSYLPPEADIACWKCGLHQSCPVASMHQLDAPSFTLQSEQRKQEVW
eukprot:scaffold35627_cov31-Tisochrysis_lutea.AAC.3